MSVIPSRPVIKNYEMNPLKDDLISGYKLEEGMLVLCEDALLRAYADKKPNKTDPDFLRFMKTRYFCRVTELTFSSSYDNGTLVTFIGVYADGVKRVNTYNCVYRWIVRLS
jgi:hypothetical protein